MKTLTTALTALAILLLSGCALVKPAADATAAVQEFPECRAELEAYLPDVLIADLEVDIDNVQSIVDRLVNASNGDIDISFAKAIELANLTEDADAVEASFIKISNYTHAFANSDRVPPQALIDCETKLVQGWSGIRSSGPAASLRDFLIVASPYIKTGVKFLPLLLQNEGRGNGIGWPDGDGLVESV